jgi:arsenate reductase
MEDKIENKVWFLSTCDTCKRIMNELDISYDFFKYHDLKNNPISALELDEIASFTGLKYEDLFNKRAQKYKLIKENLLSDEDYKHAIIGEYTFLKRPILKIDGEYFVGNSKSVVASAKDKLM